MSENIKDIHVFAYQKKKEAQPLINQYRNYLNKYLFMISSGSIDFNNWDIKCFFSLYIADKELRSNLQNKKVPQESKQAAYNILHFIKKKLKSHSESEIFHELLIPFLECASSYKDKGKGFSTYLYAVFKYNLKRHLDEIPLYPEDYNESKYKDIEFIDQSDEIDEDGMAKCDEYNLSLPNWIYGDRSSYPFSELEPHERYILAKYYHGKNTDKEIARMIPFHPKSIHRIRTRIQNNFSILYSKGELKCLRM